MRAQKIAQLKITLGEIVKKYSLDEFWIIFLVFFFKNTINIFEMFMPCDSLIDFEIRTVPWAYYILTSYSSLLQGILYVSCSFFCEAKGPFL